MGFLWILATGPYWTSWPKLNWTGLNQFFSRKFGHGEHVPLPRGTFENWIFELFSEGKQLNFQRYVFLGYVFARPDFGIFTKKLGHFTKNDKTSDENQVFPWK